QRTCGLRTARLPPASSRTMPDRHRRELFLRTGIVIRTTITPCNEKQNHCDNRPDRARRRGLSRGRSSIDDASVGSLEAGGGCRMAFLFGSMRWLAGALLASLVALGAQPVAAGTIKLGVLKFGTVNWELDVIKANGLDKAEGLDLQTVDLANTGAPTVSLPARRVDVSVTRWL